MFNFERDSISNILFCQEQKGLINEFDFTLRDLIGSPKGFKDSRSRIKYGAGSDPESRKVLSR